MSSINLLPNGPVVQKKEIKKETKSASLISFCLIVISIISLAYLYFDNQNKMGEVVSLESQSLVLDVEINKEIAKNKLLSADSKEDKITFLLSKHSYFTKAIYFIQDNLIDEAYIEDLKITFSKEKSVNVEMSGVARKYSNLATQLYVFKNLPIAYSFDPKIISENDLGDVDFTGNLNLDSKSVLYGSGDDKAINNNESESTSKN
jgi:hypothetical protein